MYGRCLPKSKSRSVEGLEWIPRGGRYFLEEADGLPARFGCAKSPGWDCSEGNPAKAAKKPGRLEGSEVILTLAGRDLGENGFRAQYWTCAPSSCRCASKASAR